MAETVMIAMVPGGGFEPPTRGFSIPLYLNENNLIGWKPSVDSPWTKGESGNRISPARHSVEGL